MRHDQHWVEDDIVKINPEEVPRILEQWASEHGVEPLLNPDESMQFLEILKQSQPQGVDVSTIKGVIAARSMPSNIQTGGMERKFAHESESPNHSRSSSSESNRSGGGPTTAQPQYANAPESPFDSKNRQRAIPLPKSNTPSSWSNKRPLPAGRRKSDAGSTSRALSDSEV